MPRPWDEPAPSGRSTLLTGSTRQAGAAEAATENVARVLVIEDEPLVGRAILRSLRDHADVELEPSPRS
jgi:hypothetical protein